MYADIMEEDIDQMRIYDRMNARRKQLQEQEQKENQLRSIRNKPYENLSLAEKELLLELLINDTRVEKQRRLNKVKKMNEMLNERLGNKYTLDGATPVVEEEYADSFDHAKTYNQIVFEERRALFDVLTAELNVQ